MVERSLFAIIDLLQGAKTFVFYSIWRVGGSFSQKQFQILEEKKFHFISFRFFFVITAP